MTKEQLSEKEELISCLQEELVKVRLREAENNNTIRELQSRIQELEQEKKTLRESTVDNSVAHLQEELIAVKLREAEANLSLKDLRHRVSELNSQWQRHLTVKKKSSYFFDNYNKKKYSFAGTSNGSYSSSGFDSEENPLLGESRERNSTIRRGTHDV